MRHARTTLAALMVLGGIGSAYAQTVSTFDTDAEGWTAYNDGTLSWSGTVGNPPGSLKIVDRNSGTYFGFQAPAAYLGDHALKYGGTLEYQSMATGSADSGATQPDVTLVGAGVTLVLDLLKPPSSAFEVRSIALDTSSAWRIGTLTGALADETQIRQVLADLTALRIRGEFTGSPDTAYLDNVRFLPAGSVIPPTIATVRLGKLSSGTVANLGTTDGTSLVVCKYVVPNQSTPPVSVELEALLPEVPTGRFGFRTFSKTTNNGLFAQRVELWDWQAGRWDPVDTVDQPVTTTPTFATVTATAPFDRYWNEGAVKARYRIRATGPVSTLLWCHELDHAAWTVDNGPG